MPVEQLHTPYVRPQANGNRTDVRWVSLTNKNGAGLYVSGSPLFNFSAHRYSDVDCEKARHDVELPKRDQITLHLDHLMRGLGSASCGPGPLPQYIVESKPFAFSMQMQILNKTEK